MLAFLVCFQVPGGPEFGEFPPHALCGGNYGVYHACPQLSWEKAPGLLGTWQPRAASLRAESTEIAITRAGGEKRKMQIPGQCLYRISGGFKGEKKLLLGSNCFGFV